MWDLARGAHARAAFGCLATVRKAARGRRTNRRPRSHSHPHTAPPQQARRRDATTDGAQKLAAGRMDPSKAPRLPRPREVSPRACLSSLDLPATRGPRTASSGRFPAVSPPVVLLQTDDSNSASWYPVGARGPDPWAVLLRLLLVYNYSPPILVPFSIQLGRSKC
ncbi:hypothetical protein PVAP13_5NG125762 [Panicum virgatum]|uniref:Uncharacterized protein n=1 Tax=Panicum virgatum TaxID=38727 RepID=A0A8T0RR00_PANVG|nr:hypothetical protein PVAP13_5NG125762 [Panicum virgatum]